MIRAILIGLTTLLLTVFGGPWASANELEHGAGAASHAQPRPMTNPCPRNLDALQNPYAYSRNNPLAFADPSGLSYQNIPGDGGCNAPGCHGPSAATYTVPAPPTPTDETNGGGILGHVGGFVKNHAADIAGIAAGVVVGGGCELLTAGSGTVACAAAGVAVSSITTTALDSNADHSISGYADRLAIDGAITVVTLGAGKLAASPLRKAVGKLLNDAAPGVRDAVKKVAARVGLGESSAANGGRTLFHYTDEAGLKGITESGRLNPSLRSVNPSDARYGNGQYLSDIAPGTKSPAQLSRAFLGQPFQGQRFTHYLELNVDGLDVIQGRPNVFVVPGESPLDIIGRIVGYGAN